LQFKLKDSDRFKFKNFLTRKMKSNGHNELPQSREKKQPVKCPPLKAPFIIKAKNQAFSSAQGFFGFFPKQIPSKPIGDLWAGINKQQKITQMRPETSKTKMRFNQGEETSKQKMKFNQDNIQMQLLDQAPGPSNWNAINKARREEINESLAESIQQNEKLKEENQKLKQAIMRVEKEKAFKINNLSRRLMQIQKKNEDLEFENAEIKKHMKMWNESDDEEQFSKENQSFIFLLF